VQNTDVQEAVKKKAAELCARFPVYQD